MIRKTFTNRLDAEQYQSTMILQDCITVLMQLGDKFRVYIKTQEEFNLVKSYHADYTKENEQHHLYVFASEEKSAINDALALKNSIKSGEIYKDYESSVEAAKLLFKYDELISASDVFIFIDDTHSYDDTMKQLIDHILDKYDYEGKCEDCRRKE